MRLLSIIGTQSAQVLENARLYQEELKLRELEGEVHAAKKIQEGFLPQGTPQMEGFDIFAGSNSAKDVGGDFFDFIKLESGCLFFTLGDVSGKGLPAALLMSTIQGQARLLINRNQDLSPDKVVRDLNYITCHLSSSSQFATIVAGCVHEGSNEVTLCNGGHNYPLLVKPDGSVVEKEGSSLLIGMLEGAEYSCCSCKLQENEILVIASDGVEEAMNENNEEFGLEAFKQLVAEHRQLAAVDIYKNILQAVSRHRGSADQSDDITILVIKKV
jgi:sigma-B regulation protein RsbU (phosphoserine phosphatase)